MNRPKSFVMVLQRRYRVFFNPQGNSWYVAYRTEGGRQRITLGVRTRPEAEAAIHKLDSAQLGRSGSDPVQFNLLVSAFLEHKQATGRASKTLSRYRAALDAFSRYLTGKKIEMAHEITLSVLEGFGPFRTLKEKCDLKTTHTDCLVIKGLLKWAAKASRGFVKLNPALDWETPEPVKPKRKTYTSEDVAKLEAGVRPWLRAIVTTLAWTGMRIDELINLRWKDIDFEQRIIHVRIQEEWKPKGRRDRTVPMHPKVEAVLRQQRVGQNVFVGPCGGRMKETRCLACLKVDQERLGLAQADLHGFRRFFATTMMQAGVSAETVRQWGGWKSLETMLRYLADVDVKDSVAAMEQAVKKLAAS